MIPSGAKLRAEGLAFFGRMTAGQSHEVTNVLNIINELAGLQLDLLGAAVAGRTPDLSRLAEIADRIQAQVARGGTIIRNVNRFAHSVDLPTAVFELGDVLERVVFLTQRYATLGRVTLDLKRPEEAFAVESNPFCIQQAVFCCLEIAITAASEHRRVMVTYRVGDRQVEIEISAADPMDRATIPAERLELLRALLDELGGVVAQIPDQAEPHRFVLCLSRRRAGVAYADSQGERDAT